VAAHQADVHKLAGLARVLLKLLQHDLLDFLIHGLLLRRRELFELLLGHPEALQDFLSHPFRRGHLGVVEKILHRVVALRRGSAGAGGRG
jgi:hypothetical protein